MNDTTPKETKSIVDDKYRKEMAARGPDWVKQLMIDETYTPEKLPEGSKKKPELTINRTKAIELATINGCGDKAAKYADDEKYNNGNVAMSLGNMLRAVAKKRFGLKRLDGTFKKIPTDDPLVADLEGPTHNKEGEPLKAKKAKKDKEEK